MRGRTLLFTALLRVLVVCIFLLLVLLDVSRSLWIDLAGLTITGALLLAVIVLAWRRSHGREGGEAGDRDSSSPSPRGEREPGGEDPTPSPTPPPPPR